MEYNHKRKKIIWWILGWIFCFPIPLTIILIRSKMNKMVKVILLSLLWFFITIGIVLDATGLSKVEEVKIEEIVDQE